MRRCRAAGRCGVLRDLGPAASQEKSTGAGKELFIDEAPVGFFSAKADGTILYLNQSLRAVLGVGEQPNLKLREIIKEDFARVLRRDRKGFAPARAAITLRARDGMEVPAIALTTWPGAETDGGSRTMVFFAGQDVPSEGAAAPRIGVPIDGFFENAPFGATLLDSADLAVATIAESNPTLMELTQGRAAPAFGFPICSTRPKAQLNWRRNYAPLPMCRWKFSLRPIRRARRMSTSPARPMGGGWPMSSTSPSSARSNSVWRRQKRCARSARWLPASHTISTIR